MTKPTPAIPDARISSQLTTRQYFAAQKAREKRRIAQEIHRRFSERYVKPLRVLDRHDDRGRGEKLLKGFTMMAIACLTIEAMESFYNGWPKTRDAGSDVFDAFFRRYGDFALFRKQGFHKHVRCGLLHQGETTEGWRITRKPAMPNFLEVGGVRWVNASKFVRAIERALEDYRQELLDADWEGVLWANARRKPQSICKNCEPT